MYDTFRLIFLIAAILCAVMFVVTIVLFIVLKIPKVISDLSGATARKAIKNIREQNERSGNKNYKVSAVNRDRGMLTDKISQSGNIIKARNGLGFGVATTKISTQQLAPDDATQTTVLSTAAETSVLSSEHETTVLSGYGETSVLQPVDETSVLQAVNETSVLDSSMMPQMAAQHQDAVFTIEFEITYIHTNEVIC